MLQHPAVYTLGAGSSREHLKPEALSSGIPLFRTERGGEVTYHGPGQVCGGETTYHGPGQVCV